MKQLSILSLLFVLFTSAAIIGKNKLSKTYTSKDHKLEVSYPGSWKVVENGPNVIRFTGPIIDSIHNTMDGSMTINAKLNSKVISTTEFYGTNMKDLQANTKDFKIIEEGEMFLGEVRSKYAIHRSKMDTTIVSTVQFYFSNGKTSFILGGTVPGETLGKYKDLYFDIAKSIKFSKK